MSHTIPTSWPLRAIQEFAVGEAIEASDVRSIPRGSQRTWSRRGARVAGLYYPAAGWQTASTSYTQTDSGTLGEDLLTWMGLLRLGRPHRSGSSLLEGLTLQVFGRELDVRATVIAVDTGATLMTLEATGGADWQWASDTQSIAGDSAHEGASSANPLRLCRVELEAKSRTVSTTATLRQWSLDHWQDMAGTQIPRGY